MMVAATRTAQKAEAKQKAMLVQKAIPDEVLKDMVSVLRGNKELLLKKAKVFRSKNAHEILFARHLAEKGLLKQYGMIAGAEEVNGINANAFSEISAIVDAAKTLRKLISEIPDPSRSPEPKKLGLPLHFECYIYESNVMGEAENRLEWWAGFLNHLDYHISAFEKIKSDLAPRKRMGAPIKAGTLKAFIEIIAKMYQAVTKEGFSVGRPEKKPPESVRFTKKAMDILHVPASPSHFKYKKFFASKQYSAQTFQSTCKQVATALRKNGGNK